MIPGNPFAPACSHETFLETLGAGEALRRLNDGLGAREPFLLVIGESGTGKTALAHEAIDRWDLRVAAVFIACHALTAPELLEEIVLRFGGQPTDGASRPKLMACLERSLTDVASAGKTAVLVVDDAHTLSPALLEELRLLVSAVQQAHLPLEVLLVGLPSLEAGLDDPALAALRQRVSVRIKLEPLSPGETRRYLRHRVTVAGGDGSGLFSRQTCVEIAALTHGVPRQINALAGEALRLAQASGGYTVGPEDVLSAAAALWGAIPARRAEDLDDDEPVETPVTTAAPRPALPKVAVRPVEEVAAPKARDEAVAAPKVRDDIVTPPRPGTVRPEVITAPRAARAAAPPPKPTKPARVEEVEPPKPAPQVSQDPQEWVARFIGSDGPVQIGSKAAQANWEPEPFEPLPANPMSPTEAPAEPQSSQPITYSPMRPRRGDRMKIATTVALATIVAAAAFALVIRVGAFSQKDIVKIPATATAASARGAESRADAPTASSSARPARVVPVSPNGRYTLDVGAVAALQDAFDERYRLHELTGIEGWVISPPEGSGKPYRIVLGIYRSFDRANSAANMLMRSKTLRNVVVVPLPPRSTRL
jgi:type II secretory pathway predicted ATPase ExeA